MDTMTRPPIPGYGPPEPLAATAATGSGVLPQPGSGVAVPAARTTVCRTVSFRAGHVVTRPHVHDFTVTVALSVPAAVTVLAGQMAHAAQLTSVDPVILAESVDEFLAEVASRLGHVMLWWAGDTEALSQPVVWPVGVAGPKLPLEQWPRRPDRPTLAGWIAAQLAEHLRGYADRGVQIAAVELETAGVGAAVARAQIPAQPSGVSPAR